MNTRTPALRINVLCAPPNGSNPGMTTVDLAFAELAAQEEFGDVTYWRLWDASEWLDARDGSPAAVSPDAFYDQDSGLSYRNVRGHLDEFLDADAVVFWGDFLHMKSYIEINADILTRRTGLFTDLDAARDVAERLLLLKGQDAATLSRVLSFGTTLGFNSVHDYAGAYGPLLDSFLGAAHRIWNRDTYSALISKLHRPGRPETTKATDAALLLGERDHGDREPTLGVFIGRSNLPPGKVGAMGRELTKQLRLDPAWIDWGRAPGFWPMDASRALQLAWPGLQLGSQAPSLRERMRAHTATLRRATPGLGPVQASTAQLLDELSRHSLVLTDTYHLALNAWRLGTPAICLTDAPQQGGWDVNTGGGGAVRDKRAELYSQFDAAPLLVDCHRLDRPVPEVVGGLVDFLREEALVEAIHSRVALLKQHARTEFTTALHALMATERPEPSAEPAAA